jgi:LCP family protein required for cell wall assembly
MNRVRLRRKRLIRERLVLFFLGSLTFVTALATIIIGLSVWKLSNVDRLTLHESLTAAQPRQVTADDVIIVNNRATTGSNEQQTTKEKEESDEFVASWTGRESQNYLLVGSDSVEGIRDGDAILSGREGSVDNHLADTIMILRLREDGTAAIVSVPRDLLVVIAGSEELAKINSAYNFDLDSEDRAARLIATIENHLKIGLQHFVEIDLDGFRKLVDAIGGVDVCFERPTRDRNVNDSGNQNQGGTGFAVDAGEHRLQGEEALAFVRSRRLLSQTDAGAWERIGVWNDLERNSRQQQFLFDALQQALKTISRSPTAFWSALNIFSTNVKTSNTFSVFDDGVALSRRFGTVDLKRDLERYTLQFEDINSDGIQGLSLKKNSHNLRVIEVFDGVRWGAVTENRVYVTVKGSEAIKLAETLSEIGFQSDTATGYAGMASRIVYGLGGEKAAALLASHFVTDIDMLFKSDLSDNELRLEVGQKPPELGQGYRKVFLPKSSKKEDATTQEVLRAPVPEVLGLCGKN